MGLTFGVLWGVLQWIAGGPAWLLWCAMGGRLAANGCSASVHARVGAEWVLSPLVELWSAAVWAASFAGREVAWAGRRLRLDRRGRIAGESSDSCR